jgi:glycosyltransferase involved in cell wall biosynthesis
MDVLSARSEERANDEQRKPARDEAGRRPLIAFGVNSSFALNHLIGHTVTSLAEKGCRVAVIAPNAKRDFMHREAFPGILVEDIDMEREIAPFSDLLALWKLIWILLRLRPAVVNMSTPKMAFLGGLAAFACGTPRRIYFLRGLRYETATGWKRRVLMACERIACACAHEVICVSASVRQCAVKAGIVAEAKTVLFGEKGSDGIYLNRFEGAPDEAEQVSRHLRAEHGIPDDAFVIGYVGRVTRDKGVGELVRATMQLAGDGRDVHLLMVGGMEAGDPIGEECSRLIDTTALIHATGYVQDPAPYYHAMDVFAFPTYREGLGKVLLEAAASGKPAVATRVTGVVDAVEDGVTGVLVPARDSGAVADAIAGLMDDAARREEMSQAGRAHVRRHFDAERMDNALAAFMTEKQEAAGSDRGAAV